VAVLGTICCSESVGDVFLEACVQAVDSMYPTPNVPGHFGRLVNEKQVHRLQELLSTHGGEVVCGGGTSEGESRYVAPTVVKVALESGMMQVRRLLQWCEQACRSTMQEPTLSCGCQAAESCATRP
jgi:acyl-CoA reductase-like NAD-dependent aldehyde dehydrogenase